VVDLLVTGAHGRTGREVLSALAGSGQSARALIRDPGQESAVRQAGAVEAVVGDLGEPETLARAVDGVAGIVHIGPPMHAAEATFTGNLLAAATAAGTERFIYYSVMHPLRREVRHHRLKLDAEQQVVESGLAFTILQPARYMQHVGAQWAKVRADGVLAFPFDSTQRFSVVDLADLAAAVATVTADSSYAYGTYELAGPEALSTVEMAEACARRLGRPVRADRVSLEAMAAAAAAAGLPADRIEQMRVMNEHYDRYGFPGSAAVLQWILGRAATPFADYLQRLPD
jgi:uncharacterized protein YbjT (DUF2867 family)